MHQRKKAVQIAYSFTQRKVESDPLWAVGKIFWKKSDYDASGESFSRLCVSCENGVAIVEYDGEQDAWAVEDLIYGQAVREALGFVKLRPEYSIEQSVNSMLSPVGHGYGFLINEQY